MGDRERNSKCATFKLNRVMWPESQRRVTEITDSCAAQGILVRSYTNRSPVPGCELGLDAHNNRPESVVCQLDSYEYDKDDNSHLRVGQANRVLMFYWLDDGASTQMRKPEKESSPCHAKSQRIL